LKAFLCVLCGLCVLGYARSVEAHPVPFTYLDLRVQPDAVEGSLVAHIFDLGHDLKIEPAERLLDPAFAAAQAAAIAALFTPRLTIAADGATLAPQWSQLEVLTDRQSLRLHVRLPIARPLATLAVDTLLFPYDPNHQTFVNIYENTALTQAILDRGRPRLEYVAGTRQGLLLIARRFLAAGAEHMVLGPEHLLFLLGLTLLGGSIRHLALIVTAFTVAHAVTTALAVFNIIGSPARIVEPAIALSLVYVGADNLLIHGGRDVRAWIALAFGVIHGLSYANALRDMSLQPVAMRWAIVAFNAGAELSQLIVAAALAAALAALRSRNEVAGRRLVLAGSVAVMAGGAILFIQRVFFPGGLS
jgi:hydrogenase/urease accessory protein HupE